MQALLAVLQRLQIPYAIGGSVASSYYGEPRTTEDIDLSLALDADAVDPLIVAFEDLGWYVPREETARAAGGGSFSVNDGFWKADLFVVRGDAFAEEALSRRREGALALTGERAWFLTPEDIILHKLRWGGGRLLDKHVRDILAVMVNYHVSLDYPYIEHWASILGVAGLWDSILDQFSRLDVS
ncbi:hypothetical protein [Aggregatilinea lenta]|uniref:hypothetical protein n=1 Tax=Aggregatilinea lenta TaxID=913108 RepID=UPI0013C2D9DE|nr:hypothetical protein [Aggregatilinea lenta]